MEEDSVLISGCLRNDRKAQYELYQKYGKQMYNVCMRMLGQESSSSDALQDGFIDVYNKLYLYNGQGPLGAWMRRIMINSCIDQLRRNKSMPVVYAEHLPEKPEEVYIEKKYGIDELMKVIDQLADGYKMIFNLYAIEGYDHEEIGQILGVSVQTSKSQYHRAKLKIKDMIEQKDLKNKILGND